MAISLGTESLTVSSQRRTWRIQIECAMGTDYKLQAFRELVRSANGEVLTKESAGVVQRGLQESITDEVTLQSGKKITVAELAEALVAHIEAWEIADLEE